MCALVEEVQEVDNQNEDFPKQILVPTGTNFSYLKCATNNSASLMVTVIMEIS